MSAPRTAAGRAPNRGIIKAALLSSGYDPAQAETRILEFEAEIRESSPVEELRRLCEQYGLTLAIEAEAAAGSGALRAALERLANAADVMLHAEDYSHHNELELIRAEKQARAALAAAPEAGLDVTRTVLERELLGKRFGNGISTSDIDHLLTALAAAPERAGPVPWGALEIIAGISERRLTVEQAAAVGTLDGWLAATPAPLPTADEMRAAAAYDAEGEQK